MSDLPLSILHTPPAAYRGIPFWSWNGTLDGKELRRQIRVMRDMGFGGFFMHSRSGLRTPYLGTEWFNAVAVCIDEAEKCGLKAWLYDEDRYASGSVGGLVGTNPHYRLRRLLCEPSGETVREEGDLAWFAGKLSGRVLRDVRRLGKEDVLKRGETFLRFRVELTASRAWDNGGFLPDLMNPGAVRLFLNMTHEKYREHCPDSFGGTVPGIFTDEPSASNWTERMEERFKKRWGLDLIEHLPELFFEIDGRPCSKLRWQFNELRTELLGESYAVPISKWCRENHLLFTGHVFGEDTVVFQTRVSGSAMRFVEHMDLPGVDLLGECWMSYDAMIQTSSVARQKGIRQTLCETYAGCGWDFSLDAQRAIASWMLALGINTFCQHLIFYTMEGTAKYDYPPSFLDQSPWHPLEKGLQDSLARIGGLLACGEAVRKILVVHPLESTWFWKNPDTLTQNEQTEENRRLPRLRNALLGAHLPFDYGDEDMILRLGRVSKGKFMLGKADYSLVVLPEMRTVRSSTLRLLEEFRAAGGTVLYLGNPPDFVDCDPSPETSERYRAFRGTTIRTLAADAEEARSFSITDSAGSSLIPVFGAETKGEDFSLLFCCNTGMLPPEHVEMSAPRVRERTLEFPDARIAWNLPDSVQIHEINPESGKLYSVETERKNGSVLFRTSFGHCATRLFLASNRKLECSERPARPSPLGLRILPEESSWTVIPDEPNVLPLDTPALSINGKFFGNEMDVLEADMRVRDVLGVPHRSHGMIQPWKWPEILEHSKYADTILRYEFFSDIPLEKVSLASEHPELCSFTLDGIPVPNADCGYWVDHSLRKIGLPAFGAGKHVLEISCRCNALMTGFEPCYLLGAFGVFNDRLGVLPERLFPGTWTEQGFPFYSGNMTYQIPFSRNAGTNGKTFLILPEFDGTALGVSVNGGAEIPCFGGHENPEITDLLHDGKNRIDLKVYGARRNSHGPFYRDPRQGFMVEPDCFETRKHVMRNLVPSGIKSLPMIFQNAERTSSGF